MESESQLTEPLCRLLRLSIQPVVAESWEVLSLQLQQT